MDEFDLAEIKAEMGNLTNTDSREIGFLSEQYSSGSEIRIKAALRSYFISALYLRSIAEFPTTETELIDIAAAANMGLSTPIAATGIRAVL